MSIARNIGESFADFKERRISDNFKTELALKPKLFHNSFYDGIYINPKRNAKKALKAVMSNRQIKKAKRKGDI